MVFDGINGAMSLFSPVHLACYFDVCFSEKTRDSFDFIFIGHIHIHSIAGENTNLHTFGRSQTLDTFKHLAVDHIHYIASDI